MLTKSLANLSPSRRRRSQRKRRRRSKLKNRRGRHLLPGCLKKLPSCRKPRHSQHNRHIQPKSSPNNKTSSYLPPKRSQWNSSLKSQQPRKKSTVGRCRRWWNRRRKKSQPRSRLRRSKQKTPRASIWANWTRRRKTTSKRWSVQALSWQTKSFSWSRAWSRVSAKTPHLWANPSSSSTTTLRPWTRSLPIGANSTTLPKPRPRLKWSSLRRLWCPYTTKYTKLSSKSWTRNQRFRPQKPRS